MVGDYEYVTPQLPELVGSREACEILGVQKMTLNRWCEPGSAGVSEMGVLSDHGDAHTYMIEPKMIGAGRVWARADVEHFAAHVGRRRAAPAPAAA